MIINILGIRRIILLAVLVALNGLMAAVIYNYLSPETQKSEALLRNVTSENQRLQINIMRMHDEFKQIDNLKDRFAKLRADGFFSEQDRRSAEARLTTIKEQSGVNSALVSIASAQAERTGLADQAKHRIMVTDMDIEITALDDVSVYRYWNLMKSKFPGHVQLESFSIRRINELDQNALTMVANGQNIDVVRAEMAVKWRTLLPNHRIKEVVENPGEFNDSGMGGGF